MILAVILVLFLLYLVIQIGELCLRYTGLDKTEARFEAIFLLVGGCSPSIYGHPVRRKIGTWLMLTGYLGTAGLIALIIQTVDKTTARDVTLTLLSIACAILLTSIGFPESWVRPFINRGLRKHYEKEADHIHMKLDESHIVFDVTVTKRMGFGGKKLKNLPFRDMGLLVMAITRGEERIQLPAGEDIVRTGDSLILYGDMAGAEILLKAV